ncbi:hypothetical protein FHU29_001018 [Hoyosella altamirensis]|uniref:Uncharacterized protein n=1 Tax=Hoyosella altamirensis TaxID=616997 RepID=A0A839RK82_9ACTN|nr:hypothetical protein [Hoyosella altamirensis]MBB3036584.1 hypothetical protein [Hoyosella altamirensis]
MRCGRVAGREVIGQHADKFVIDDVPGDVGGFGDRSAQFFRRQGPDDERVFVQRRHQQRFGYCVAIEIRAQTNDEPNVRRVRQKLFQELTALVWVIAL